MIRIIQNINVYRWRVWLSVLAALVLVGAIVVVVSFQSTRVKATGLDSNVTLMLHMDGTDGSTTFTDSSDSAHSVTVTGAAQIDTAESKFGGASGLFDFSTAELSVAHATDFDFSGDFTIDMWIRPEGLNSILYADNDGLELIFGTASDSGSADLNFDIADASISCNQAITTGSWQHVAAVRSGSTVTVYDNGVACGSDASASAAIDISEILIGAFVLGHIDELRVSKGVARWTSDFTPPTQAYSTSTAPSAPTLHDSGGSTRIAFNNARQSTTTPTFRISAVSDTSFNRFEIQLATTTDFSSQIYTHTASSTFAASTAYNITADALSPSLPTTDDTTYYVRVRASADSGSTWSNWSTDNNPVWSFTYKASGDVDWYQTTAGQFGLGTLSDTATTTGGVELGVSGGSISFVGGTTGIGSNSTYAVDLTPLSLQEDDVVLVMNAFMSAADEDPGVTTSGYTEISDLYADGTVNDTNVSVAWKAMSSSPDSSVTCNGSSNAARGSVCVVQAYRGVDTTTPMDVAETEATGSGAGEPNGPSITPSTNGAYVVVTGAGTAANADTSVTAPSGFSNQTATTTDPGNAATGAMTSLAWTSGAVDPLAWTDWSTTGAGASWGAVSMALRPSAGGSATTGTTTSPAIDYDFVPGANGWDEVSITADITNGAVTVNVLGADQQPLSSYTCTVSGSTCTIDLSTLDPEGTSNEATIYLQAVLTDSGGSPVLEDWGVSWITTSPPTVTTSAASSVTGSTATLNGDITNTGGITGAGTQHGFAWGTNATLSSGVSTTTLGTYSGTGTFNEGISSLTPGTTYYFRAYAVNSIGTSTGSIESFVTNSLPTLSISEPDGTGDTVTVGNSYDVTYTLADSDDVVTAAFFYDTDGSGLDGVPITGACATAAEGTDATCSWDTTGITPGNYYVYGTTTDGVNSEVSAYSSGQITIAPADATAPTPDPMTFASAPSNDSATQISMTATTASDDSTPIEYRFRFNTCASDGGTGGATSSWQTSTTYANSGLQPNQCYGYAVEARDAALNTGTVSSVAETYTSAAVPGAPTFAGVSQTTFSIVNDANGNPISNPVTEFAVQIHASSPTDSTWDGKYIDTNGDPSDTAVWMSDAVIDALVVEGLTASTTYSVRVKARNEDGDETAFSSTGQVMTSIVKKVFRLRTGIRLRGGTRLR